MSSLSGRYQQVRLVGFWLFLLIIAGACAGKGSPHEAKFDAGFAIFTSIISSFFVLWVSRRVMDAVHRRAATEGANRQGSKSTDQQLSFVELFVQDKRRTFGKAALIISLFPVSYIALRVVVHSAGQGLSAETVSGGLAWFKSTASGSGFFWAYLVALGWILAVQIDLSLIEFRVRRQLFGSNANEAQELIDFARQRVASGGGGWGGFLPDSHSPVAVDAGLPAAVASR